MGRRTIAAAFMVTALATPTAALAGPPLEEGATFFEDGSCQEQDGTPGMSQPDGQCVTIADYDYMFSYENLNSIPSVSNPELSIAEHSGLVNDGTPASERPLGEGLIEEYPTKTFANQFAPTGWERNPYSRWGTGTFYVNGLPIRLA